MTTLNTEERFEAIESQLHRLEASQDVRWQ